MEREKQLRDSGVIAASEIGQYHFCPVSWYLQKLGFKPDSQLLEVGSKKHIQHGKVIDETNLKIKKSKVFAIAGYLLLILAVLFFTFEVVL